MRSTNIPLYQIITNKANSLQDFTFNLKDSNRYIVSYRNIFTGKNPSLDFDLVRKVSNVLQYENCSSIGGWMDQKTNIYYLDCNKHFFYLKDAITFAKLNNQISIFDTYKKEVLYTKNFDLC